MTQQKIQRVAAGKIFPLVRSEGNNYALLSGLQQPVAVCYNPDDAKEGGVIFNTAPFKTNESFNLLGISDHDALRNLGMIDSTDSIDPAIALAGLYVRVSHSDGFGIYRVAMRAGLLNTNSASGQFTALSPRQVGLKLEQASLVLDTGSWTPPWSEEPEPVCPLMFGAPMPYEKLVVDFNASFTVGLETGTTTSVVEVTAAHVLKNGTEQRFTPNLVDIVGFDLDVHRVNHNRRPATPVGDTQEILNVQLESTAVTMKDLLGCAPASLGNWAEQVERRGNYLRMVDESIDAYLPLAPATPGLKVDQETLKRAVRDHLMRQFDAEERKRLSFHDTNHVGADGTQITSHVVEGEKTELIVQVGDEPGPGNGNHRYTIHGFDTSTNPSRSENADYDLIVMFQNGTLPEKGQNGVTIEALLAVCAHRLQGFQNGPYACDANQRALESIKLGLGHLQNRTRERIARQVEGQHKA